ncbi:MAG: TfoX/Sxy family protein [Rhodoferax sp.]|nr:TfoX/Sxy family protein [Rhodoferax sp.]
MPSVGGCIESPKSQQVMAKAGISSVEQLRKIGSVAAYVRAKRTGANVSLNLLWALEGTISGLHWQEVARDHRTSLLLALEDQERRAPPV